MVNFLLLIPSFLLAVYYPKVGNLAALFGSFTTMLCIYMLPVGTFLKMKWDQIKNFPAEQLEGLTDKDGVLFAELDLQNDSN